MSFMLGFRPDYGIPRVCGLVGLGEGLSSSAPRASSVGGRGLGVGAEHSLHNVLALFCCPGRLLTALQ